MAPSTPTAAPQDGLVERLTERAAREDYGAGLREDLRRARGLIAELERKLEIVSNWTGEYRQRASLAEDALAAQAARIAELERERDEAKRLCELGWSHAKCPACDADMLGVWTDNLTRAEIAEAALAAQEARIAELGRERDADAICYGALREQAERAEIAEAALAAAQRHLEVADQIAERYAVLGGRDTTLLQQYQQLRKG